MKRYLIFAGSTYYPSGGYVDISATFETEAECRAWMTENVDDETWDKDFQWAHFLDTTTWVAVNHDGDEIKLWHDIVGEQ